MAHTNDSTVFRTISVVLVIGAVAAGGYAIRHTVSCFLLSFVIAYLLDPLMVYMEKCRIKRGYGIVVLYALLGVLSLFAMLFIVPLVADRWISLLQTLPSYVQKMKGLMEVQKAELINSPAFSEWEWLLDSASTKLDAVAGKLGSGVYSAASSLAFNLFNLILAPILVFFMLHYKPQILDGLKVWLPLRHKDHILKIGVEINDSIGGYLRGQLIVSAIVAVFSTIALFILDVDYALLNGLFAGAASVLPFIGVFLATVPPLFFAYIKFQNGTIILKVIGSFAAIYFLEGYLVKPLVFKESMNLNPLMTVIVVMAFGEMMGFWGILLAIPIAAALKIMSIHWRRGDFSVKE
ncbi:MAG: AI-2E family transporter [Geobacteraceae bacterium]|nr:AI-2E family transporter [Geobacteraceae bacterium]